MKRGSVDVMPPHPRAAAPQEVKATSLPSSAGALVSPLGVIVLCLLGLGTYLRVHALGVPSVFQFDEHHFVENARNYMNHQADWNDHPPLGKLMIAFAMRLFGDTPVGWRASELVAGFLTVIVGGLAAARLFKSPSAGWLAAALISADGFFISYSRAALLDGFLVAAAVAALLVSTFPMTWGAMLLGGAIAGIAACVKFSGVGVFPPLLVALILAPHSLAKKASLAAILVGTALVVYTGFYAYGLSIARHPASVFDVFSDTSRLVAHHAALTDMKNPATSGWITWILPKRPILLAYVGETGRVRAATTLGNLAVWWASVGLAVTVVALLLWRGVEWALSQAATDPKSTSGLSPFVATHARSVLILLALAGGFLAPWVLTHRDSYIYHFLPTYAPLVILLGGYVAWVRAREPSTALFFMAVVLVVAGFYAPVWSVFPVTFEGLRLRLFLDGWR